MITLTHTSLSMLQRCPYAYNLRNNWRLAPSGYRSALEVGRAVHAGVEAGGCLVAAKCALGDATVKHGVADDVGARDAAIVECLMHAWRLGPGSESRPTEHEVVLSSKIARGVVVAGVVDGYMQDGSRYELKTTSSSLEQALHEFAQSLQWHIYTLLDERKVPTVLDVVRKPNIRPRKDEPVAEWRQRCVDAIESAPQEYATRAVMAYSEERVERARYAIEIAARQIRMYRNGAR